MHGCGAAARKQVLSRVESSDVSLSVAGGPPFIAYPGILPNPRYLLGTEWSAPELGGLLVRCFLPLTVTMQLSAHSSSAGCCCCDLSSITADSCPLYLPVEAHDASVCICLFSSASPLCGLYLIGCSHFGGKK
jgi:hypothetical protein